MPYQIAAIARHEAKDGEERDAWTIAEGANRKGDRKWTQNICRNLSGSASALRTGVCQTSYQVETSARRRSAECTAGIRPLLIRDFESVDLGGGWVDLGASVGAGLWFARKKLVPLSLWGLERVLFSSCLLRIEMVLF